MKIGIIGGTGKEGRGLALRWATTGHDVIIGSRHAERGEAKAAELDAGRGRISGGGNARAAAEGEIVVLAVPYGAHGPTLTAMRDHLRGQLLIDITVPLRPPKVRLVHLPEGNAAALEAAAIVGDKAIVAAALHHVSSAHLADPHHEVDCDVLVCCDDKEKRAVAIGAIEALGLRGIDAGPLRNAIALEAMTPVLLHIARRYKASGPGLRISGLP